MPNNNYILTSNGELYHSSEYRKTVTNTRPRASTSSNKVHVLIHGQLMEVDEDTLMHWKYIKREWKNGRWVYTYDESYLEDIRKSAQDAKEEADLLDNTFDYPGPVEEAKSKQQKYKDISDNLFKLYEKEKVSSFLERTISKGIVKVANFFSNLFSKKK